MLDDMLTSLQRLGVVGETINVELNEQRQYGVLASDTNTNYSKMLMVLLFLFLDCWVN